MRKWRCRKCGFLRIAEEAPSKCMVCGAPRGEFEGLAHVDLPKWRRFLPPIFLHPILVHFPIALIPTALLFYILYLLFGGIYFENIDLYILIIALLLSPLAAASGFFDWKTQFNGVWTFIFKMKLIGAVILIVLLFIVVVWRILDDTIFLFAGSKLIYFMALAAASAIVGMLGRYGGLLIFSRCKIDIKNDSNL